MSCAAPEIPTQPQPQKRKAVTWEWDGAGIDTSAAKKPNGALRWLSGFHMCRYGIFFYKFPVHRGSKVDPLFMNARSLCSPVHRGLHSRVGSALDR